MLDVIFVCKHAIQRWQERISSEDLPVCYLKSDIIQAVKSAKRVGKNDFLPFHSEKNKVYFYHEKFKAYFVLEPIDEKSSRVLTIIVPDKPNKTKTLEEILSEKDIILERKSLKQQLEMIRLDLQQHPSCCKDKSTRSQLISKMKEIEFKLSIIHKQLKD